MEKITHLFFQWTFICGVDGMPSSRLPSWTRAGIHHCATHCQLYVTPCAAASATCRAPARRCCTDMQPARSTSAGWVCRQSSDDSSGIVYLPALAGCLAFYRNSICEPRSCPEAARPSGCRRLRQRVQPRAMAQRQRSRHSRRQHPSPLQHSPGPMAQPSRQLQTERQPRRLLQRPRAMGWSQLTRVRCVHNNRHINPKSAPTMPLQHIATSRQCAIAPVAPIYRSCFQHLYRGLQAQNPKWKRLAAAALRANGGVMKTTKLQRSLLKSANCGAKTSKDSLKADMLSKVGSTLTECSLSAILFCLD